MLRSYTYDRRVSGRLSEVEPYLGMSHSAPKELDCRVRKIFEGFVFSGYEKSWPMHWFSRIHCDDSKDA